MRHVRNGSARTKLERLGRYSITEPIASGGMGFVYSAYDPELDRKVALKVVHPRRSHNPGSHARLLKEARALARLDHPNVVKVHDVFSEAEQIVVVMELVEGSTLADWEKAEVRTWRDAIAVYAQAGEGLAAAHALDIVHRDFKPANAIIGPDGRVRVLDFGLAQMVGNEVDLGDPTSSGAITQTIPGAVMGTPAYSAPEQLAGETVTAASDQFSFCVALHRVIEGCAPFSGESVDELVAAIKTQSPTTSKRDLPTWLRELVARGLAADPDRRHPSMRALLRELTRARGVKRWWKPAAIVGLVATTAVTNVAMRSDAPAAPCSFNEVAAIWNPFTRARTIVTIQGLSTPYAREVAAQVLPALDKRASAIGVTERNVCLAHHDGASSDLLFDRETACLDQRRSELQAALDVVGQLSSLSVSGAVDVVNGLHDSAECGNSALIGDGELPAVEERASVRADREVITRSAALRRAGRYDDAKREVGSAIATARSLKYQPVLAEALLELGRIQTATNGHQDSIRVLSEALQLGLTNNLVPLAVEAEARRIYAYTRTKPDIERIVTEFELVDAMSRSIKGEKFARALLLNNLAAAYQLTNRPADASRYYELAHEVSAGSADVDNELVTIDLNRAMLIRDRSSQATLFTSTVDKLTSKLGPHHPQTLDAKLISGAYAETADAAMSTWKPVCADYHQLHPSLVGAGMGCERALAQIADCAGDTATAKLALETAIALRRDDDLDDMVVLSQGELAYYNRDDRAESLLRRSIEINSGTDTWSRTLTAEAKLFLARIAAARGDRKLQRELAANASSEFADIAKTNFALMYLLRVQQASSMLAPE
ncbi:MAG: serine/threonine-protein kinase [Kofleriaceae bacterium]